MKDETRGKKGQESTGEKGEGVLHACTTLAVSGKRLLWFLCVVESGPSPSPLLMHLTSVQNPYPTGDSVENQSPGNSSGNSEEKGKASREMF